MNNFLRFAPEQRLRIYYYAFGDTTIRYARPVPGRRARCYSAIWRKLGLLTTSKAIYLEAWPLYLSLIRLVLVCTCIDDIPACLQATVLPKIRSVELMWSPPHHFDPTKLPALRTLKLTEMCSWVSVFRIGLGDGTDGDHIDGRRDHEIVQWVRQRLEIPRSSAQWLPGVIKQKREFRILQPVRKHFDGPRRATLVTQTHRHPSFEQANRIRYS
jgi:hypothetical protein